MEQTGKSQKMEASTSSRLKSLEKADLLLEELRKLGYIPEQLPKIEDSDSLYMALRNKKLTGRFELD